MKLTNWIRVNYIIEKKKDTYPSFLIFAYHLSTFVDTEGHGGSLDGRERWTRGGGEGNARSLSLIGFEIKRGSSHRL